MDKISNSKELYEFILSQSMKDIPDGQLMTLYMLAVQKNLDEDIYMLAINLSYILNLRSSGGVNVRTYFMTMKMKYYKYFGFWKEYISFEIEESVKPIEKVLESSIKYVSLKEFKDKEGIKAYLEGVYKKKVEGGDLREYVTEYEGRVIRVEEINGDSSRNKDIKNGEGSNEKDTNDPLKENIHNNINNNIHNFNFKEISSVPFIYSPRPKKVVKEEDKFQLKTPISEMNISWSKKLPFKLDGTSPERKLKFSNYQSPTKEILHDDNTVEIMLEGVRNSETFRRKLDHHCTISDKQYRKCGIIGKGGNSKVYLVENSNKFYALKVVNIEMDGKLKKSTLKEIEILRNLKGSYGIIELVDTRVDVDNIYILMEYGSIDLAKYIRKNTLTQNAVRFFWEQMLKILQVVHSNRIIHADIKPANFVIVDGNLKLIDFNISSKIKADTTRLDLESACGTLNYVAPEILDNSIKQRRRGSDVWSLGIILYEMIYKRVPVDYTTSSSDWLEKIQNMESLIKDDEGVSRDILETIRACLRRNPKERPTVEELLKRMT